jgi:hypothetical protein
MGNERGFNLIISVSRDLVITRVAVEERRKFVVGRRVDHFVDTRETKGVFRTVFVEINVINAHSPFIILFSYKYWIGKPIWM